MENTPQTKTFFSNLLVPHKKLIVVLVAGIMVLLLAILVVTRLSNNSVNQTSDNQNQVAKNIDSGYLDFYQKEHVPIN